MLLDRAGYVCHTPICYRAHAAGVSPTDTCASALAAQRMGVRTTPSDSGVTQAAVDSHAELPPQCQQQQRQQQLAGAPSAHPMTPAAGQQDHVCADAQPTSGSTAPQPHAMPSHHHVHAGHPHHPLQPPQHQAVQGQRHTGNPAAPSSTQAETQAGTGGVRRLVPLSLPSLGLGSKDSQAVLEKWVWFCWSEAGGIEECAMVLCSGL